MANEDAGKEDGGKKRPLWEQIALIAFVGVVISVGAALSVIFDTQRESGRAAAMSKLDLLVILPAPWIVICIACAIYVRRKYHKNQERR